MKLKTRGGTTAEAIVCQTIFDTHGALKTQKEFTGWGRLNDEELKQYFKDRGQEIYVVYSYATPIAWVTKKGGIYIVKQKFSKTTSSHQGQLYLLKAENVE